MATDNQRVVLLSGCSSGIGRARAREMVQRGQRVYATARRPETLDDLSRSSVPTLALDVTDRGSIERAVATVIEREGRIDMLINNAGMNSTGPLAELPLDEVRRLYEANVFGLLAVTQVVFPHMAARKSGRIVNIGSVVGELPTPFGGAYCSSKSAVHMLSEVLRMEVAPFGIDVVVVKPGGVRSSISDNAEQLLSRYAAAFKFYKPFAKQIMARARTSQDTGNPMDTERFARGVCAHLLRRRCPHEIRRGSGARVLPPLARTPIALRDAILSRRFGLHRPEP